MIKYYDKFCSEFSLLIYNKQKLEEVLNVVVCGNNLVNDV